ncbi:alkylglycerol monooxygenase isoform X4 [Ahaetulla prasina]|uniref:alkylglycerol monooxygenase isoform X4 n=1 Tax=Ahaetulla prasina TaxID=499056 RepID=UPI002647D4BE|nr:alkylglycerol monooxygenase isoform X4 [Ahaetulla prasina]
MAAATAIPKQAVSVFQEFRAMFYVLGPSESSFRSVKEVPDYVDKATPLFVTLILLEVIIKWVQKRHFSFLHSDDITSLSAGIFSRIPDVISRSVEISAYIYVWNNYRMMELPWDSSWTWYLTFIGVDFGYYWFHRMAHGRNPYCIDKNYGGTLIIWDRIFGTFAAEKDKVVYGLTHPINTFESLKVQFHHCVYIWSIFWTTPGFVNKLSVIFKGPGWAPGKPRLGLIEEIPEVTGKEVPFNRKLPSYMSIYVIMHFALMMGFYVDLTTSKYTLSQVTLLMRVGYIVLTLTSIGFLMDQRPEMTFMESARCSAFLALQKLGYLEVHSALLSTTSEVLFSLCIAFWGIQIIKQLTSNSAKQH